MRSKLFRLATPLLAALSAQASAQAPQSGGTLFEDRQREIEVRHAFTPGNVEFSANLPAGWTFSISIDGDQNGRWGNGPEGIATGETSGDRSFGQDSGHGAFCAQYILTTDPGNPEQVYASSDCNGYPSHGRVEMTQPDARRRTTITLRIPSAEVFGTHRDARLRACVYDGRRWTCQRWLATLFVLRNPDAASAD
jgi:hypothetical protein